MGSRGLREERSWKRARGEREEGKEEEWKGSHTERK